METVNTLQVLSIMVFAGSWVGMFMMTIYAFLNEVKARHYATLTLFALWNTLLTGRVWGWW